MKVELVKIEDVRPLERNPRMHGEKQLAELVRSIEQFGQYRPLVVDETGEILAGNGLYLALRRTGAKKVAVHRLTGLTQDQRTKLILADNRIGDLSADDIDTMMELFRELSDFEVPGYDADSLRQLLAETEDLLDDAQQFGILPPETVERMNAEAEKRGDLDDGATSGPLPPSAGVPEGGAAAPAPQSAGGAAGVPDGTTEPAPTWDGNGPCPTCGRP